MTTWTDIWRCGLSSLSKRHCHPCFRGSKLASNHYAFREIRMKKALLCGAHCLHVALFPLLKRLASPASSQGFSLRALLPVRPLSCMLTVPKMLNQPWSLRLSAWYSWFTISCHKHIRLDFKLCNNEAWRRRRWRQWWWRWEDERWRGWRPDTRWWHTCRFQLTSQLWVWVCEGTPPANSAIAGQRCDALLRPSLHLWEEDSLSQSLDGDRALVQLW